MEYWQTIFGIKPGSKKVGERYVDQSVSERLKPKMNGENIQCIFKAGKSLIQTVEKINK